ncbi:ABC transporter permease [Labrys sp. (in: a-proteobacteria)]
MTHSVPQLPPIRKEARAKGFLHGLAIQLRVIGALMIREVMARYGHENLGFFWIIGEPLLLTLGVMVLWTFTGQSHGGEEVGVIPFALTGYSFLTLWRHLVFKSMRVMTNGSPLVYHIYVKYFDILLARGLLEVISIFAAFLIALLPLWLVGLCPGINDPLLLVVGWLLCSWFSFSFALIIAAVSEFSETVHQIVGPAMYLTMPLTGAFFLVDWLPPRAREIMLWSPMVNGVEMFRAGLFPPDVPTEWDAGYIVAWSLALTVIALPLVRYAERRVESA